MFALLFLFVIAAMLGFELINKVPPTLHTPLMSGCNAISGVTIVGAISAVTAGQHWIGMIFGCLAIALATTNVVGGFMVTDRMLAMFKRKG